MLTTILSTRRQLPTETPSLPKLNYELVKNITTLGEILENSQKPPRESPPSGGGCAGNLAFRTRSTDAPEQVEAILNPAKPYSLKDFSDLHAQFLAPEPSWKRVAFDLVVCVAFVADTKNIDQRTTELAIDIANKFSEQPHPPSSGISSERPSDTGDLITHLAKSAVDAISRIERHDTARALEVLRGLVDAIVTASEFLQVVEPSNRLLNRIYKIQSNEELSVSTSSSFVNYLEGRTVTPEVMSDLRVQIQAGRFKACPSTTSSSTPHGAPQGEEVRENSFAEISRSPLAQKIIQTPAYIVLENENLENANLALKLLSEHRNCHKLLSKSADVKAA